MNDSVGFLARTDLQRLVDTLQGRGYVCVGPTVRDGAIQFAELTRVGQLPLGWREHQAPGSYRLHDRGDDLCFAWANGAQALKPLSFAPEEILWRSRRSEQGLEFEPAPVSVKPTAVIGARACDLAGLALQERHFHRGAEPDPAFSQRRAALLLIAVDCTHPAATCFCAATGDGPEVANGFDLRLHELDEGFLIWSGGERGAQVLNALDPPAASEEQLHRAERSIEQAAARQQRRLPDEPELMQLFESLDHPHWDAVAERCLACGNCTAVCPTCFCSSYEARPSLDGRSSDQVRLWDSCFQHDHSVMHGRAVRDDIRLRYRQWLTHKLAGWQAQYGRSGCVGCGRCISWCPVGIDLTAEVPRLLAEGPE